MAELRHHLHLHYLTRQHHCSPNLNLGLEIHYKNKYVYLVHTQFVRDISQNICVLNVVGGFNPRPQTHTITPP